MARQQRRLAFWSDARFFIGVGLVIAAVGGVWITVDSSRRTTPVMVAARTLTPGHVIDSDDLRVAEVVLGPTAVDYLAPDDIVSESIAGRTVLEGELVPLSAIDPASAASTTTVVVDTVATLPASVRPGSGVELWVAPLVDQGRFGDPRILVDDATIAAVREDSSLVGARGTALEVVIPRTSVAETLATIANGDALSVIPRTAP